jgi:uncharacterized Zn finger protein
MKCDYCQESMDVIKRDSHMIIEWCSYCGTIKIYNRTDGKERINIPRIVNEIKEVKE